VLFNAGCKEQVFSPKLWKKNCAVVALRKRKRRTFNSEKWRHRSEGC